MFRFLFPMLSVVAGIFFYMYRQAGKTAIKYHEVPFFDGDSSIRMLFLTDLHNRKITQSDIWSCRGVDFICLGGDIVESATKQKVVEKNLELLSEIAPVFFVWGNNDYYREKLIKELIMKYKLQELNNASRYFQTDNWTLAGVADKTLGFHNIKKALEHGTGPVLLLSHNPEIVWDIPDKSDVRLVLAGHTHGGQIRIGRFGIDELGGMKQKNRRKLLLSNGYGTTGLPLRLGAEPQIHIITLVKAERDT